jgi:hypothetical protein
VVKILMGSVRISLIWLQSLRIKSIIMRLQWIALSFAVVQKIDPIKLILYLEIKNHIVPRSYMVLKSISF